jgi:NAD(P)-dependent dehydrogenase (short-subunit alcohol dehydrogenase family)
MRELARKTAFVTGGASGIGLALGRAFAGAGMKVMVSNHRHARRPLRHPAKVGVTELRHPSASSTKRSNDRLHGGR